MCRHFIGHESSLNNFFSPPPLKKENKSCLLATQSHKWNSHRKNGPIRTTITSLNCKVIYTKVEWVGMHFSCLHAFIQWHQARAGWIFHPSTSSGSIGSYKQAAPCMQARKTHAHSFYLLDKTHSSHIAIYWLNIASNEAYVLHPLQALCLICCRKWPVDGATDLFV